MRWYLKVLKKYAVSEGRARRKEYWVFFLVNMVVIVGLSALDAALGTMGLLSGLYLLVIIVPGIAVTVRRLHDTGRSAWWLAILAVPIIGAIIFFVFLLQDSDPGANEYGPNPKTAGTGEQGSGGRILPWAIGLLTVALVAGGGAAFLHYFKNTDAHRTAQAFVRQNPRVQSLVGDEMEFAWFPQGKIQGSQARFTLNVTGSRGEAVVVVRLVRKDTAWAPVEAVYRADGERGQLQLPGEDGRSSRD